MTAISKYEASQRLAGVLEAAGITADIRVETVWSLEFPDGAQCYEEDFYIVANGREHQRTK